VKWSDYREILSFTLKLRHRAQNQFIFGHDFGHIETSYIILVSGEMAFPQHNTA